MRGEKSANCAALIETIENNWLRNNSELFKDFFNEAEMNGEALFESNEK